MEKKWLVSKNVSKTRVYWDQDLKQSGPKQIYGEICEFNVNSNNGY